MMSDDIEKRQRDERERRRDERTRRSGKTWDGDAAENVERQRGTGRGLDEPERREAPSEMEEKRRDHRK